jgi:hypothetical protein
MANGKLQEYIDNDLSDATLDGTERFYVTKSSTSKRTVLSAILSYIQGAWPARHPGYVSGRWYRGFWYGLQTAAVNADQLCAHPIVLTRAITIQSLGIRCGTGVAASTMRMGIYSNNNGVPGDLLHQINSTPSTASSNTNVTGGFASNPTLQPGVYWMATLFSGTPSVSSMASTDAAMLWALGVADGSSLSTGQTGVTGVATYAGGLPASFGTATYFTGAIPSVMMRAA